MEFKSKSWKALQPGDIVDVIAPASSCVRENLDKGVAILESWGLKPRVPKEIFSPDVICASPDKDRFAQLKRALYAKDSKAIWCVRGGYGANRLVPELAKLKAPAGPAKLFIGYSDITTLHAFLNRAWNWGTIHGPMVDRIGRGLIEAPQLTELQDVFFGRQPTVVFKNLRPMNRAARSMKTLSAPVTGGNLMTLQSSIGTQAPWDTRGRIVFLEEIDERGYRTDRILEHLAQTGHFEKATAIVLGEFVGGDEADGSNRNPVILERFAQSLAIPVLSGVEAGHGKMQRPVPFETMATLDLKNSTLVIETGVEAVDADLVADKSSKATPKLKSAKTSVSKKAGRGAAGKATVSKTAKGASSKKLSKVTSRRSGKTSRAGARA